MVTVTQEFIDIITANKATAKMYTPSSTGGNVAKTVLTVGMSITKSTIEISVPTGYEIQVATFRDDYGFEKSYNISTSKLIATTTDTLNFMSGFNLEVKQLTPNVQGVNQVYELDVNAVGVISSKQFEFFNGQTVKKYGDYILGLIKLPFAIPKELIVSENAIVKMGNFDSGVKGKLLNAEKLTINLGSITTPLKFNNTLDFINTTCILYLPYCEPINLENEYVIGQTISIQYIVNLYSGELLINITSSKNNEIIISKNIDLDIDVPFSNVQARPPKNDSRDIKLGKDNGVKNPHIVIMRNDAILPHGFFTIPITDEKQLQDETGFVKIDEIELSVNAPDNEKDSIISLLNNGVIIK